MMVLERTRESFLLSLLLAAIVVGSGVWRYRAGSVANTARAGQARVEEPEPIQTA